jgi:methylated-DNA-[protein]-cysteine S-methyltransferase
MASFAAVLHAPFGALGVREAEGVVTEILFLPPGTSLVPPATPASRELAEWISAYLTDPDAPSPLTLVPAGTPFQRRVWAAIARIPRGQVRRYADLARELGSVPRAVGQACGANPLPLLIPCHRVVSAQGLGGFANAREGYLLDTKRWLLAHEGVL